MLTRLIKRFANDTNLTATGESICDIETTVNSDLENLRIWLNANKLSLNMAKTEFIVIGSKPILASVADTSPNIFIDSKPIKQINEYKHLSWKSNTDYIGKRITSGIFALRRIRQFVDRDTLLYVYKSLVIKFGGYLEKQSKRLQKLQNRSTGIILGLNNDADPRIALNALGWEPLNVERKPKPS